MQKNNLNRTMKLSLEFMKAAYGNSHPLRDVPKHEAVIQVVKWAREEMKEFDDARTKGDRFEMLDGLEDARVFLSNIAYILNIPEQEVLDESDWQANFELAASIPSLDTKNSHSWEEVVYTLFEVLEHIDKNSPDYEYEVLGAVVAAHIAIMLLAKELGFTAEEFDNHIDLVYKANMSKLCETLEEADTTVKMYAEGTHPDKLGEKIEGVTIVETFNPDRPYRVEKGKTLKSYKFINPNKQ